MGKNVSNNTLSHKHAGDVMGSLENSRAGEMMGRKEKRRGWKRAFGKGRLGQKRLHNQAIMESNREDSNNRIQK